MPDPEKLDSLLVADCGSVNTKVGFVDRVGGEYRFVGVGVSATTSQPPAADVLVGVRRAMEQIETRTNRRFLADDGQLITPERATGQGVDAFVAITSAPLPLRVAIVGLCREVSVASAARAVNSTYATVGATLALDETGERWLRTNVPGNNKADHKKSSGPPEDPAVVAAEALARADPEVIVLVGGIDGGATTALYEIANLVAAIAASREESARPAVVFAGNREARPQIVSRVGQVAPLLVVDNVHPALDRENYGALQSELEALYVERKIARLPGLGGLTSWSQRPVIPTARAFENVVRFLSRRYDLSVLGVDIGGTSTTLVTARREAYARVVRADLGVGYTLENVIAQAGVDRLIGWLPSEVSAEDLLAHSLNHSLRPTTIPATRQDAQLLQAAAREALSITARTGAVDTSSVDLILLTGAALSRNSNWGSLALIVLDALQPRGVFTLAVDGLGLAPAFGALASVNAEAAASVIERDGFVTLGTVIVPTSNNREGQIDVRVQVRPAGSAEMNLEVQHGSLEVVPLAPGQKASLEVRVARGVALGPTHRGVFKAEIEGGVLGLIIDARGRPLALPPNAEKCRAKIQEWLWDVGG
jgi:hypothetical protein